MSKKSDKVKTEGFEIVKTYPEFEIRNYDKSTVAQVALGSGNYENLSSQGFRQLATYIFGGNASEQQIAMTSPVMMQLGDSMEMYFFMPKEYALESLPSPNNPDIQLSEIDAKKVAVISFGGWANQSKIEYYQSHLTELLAKENIAHDGNFFFLGYNAPYEMVNRKNEVMVTLK